MQTGLKHSVNKLLITQLLRAHSPCMAVWDRYVCREARDPLRHAKQNVNAPRALTFQVPLEPQWSQDCALCVPLRAPRWAECLPTSVHNMLQAEHAP